MKLYLHSLLPHYFEMSKYFYMLKLEYYKTFRYFYMLEFEALKHTLLVISHIEIFFIYICNMIHQKSKKNFLNLIFMISLNVLGIIALKKQYFYIPLVYSALS